MNTESNSEAVATLGGGCFWCLEPVFQELEGVGDVVVGYAGGSVEEPTYQQVCTGNTGHAEVVNIPYDPSEISYRELLEIFFNIHNPTTKNRQGADVGTQYRSIILYHTEKQKATAESIIEEIESEGIWNDPVVTEVEEFEAFYRAEDYHQEYYEKNPNAGYCQVVIAPKMSKFRKQFKSKLE
ncbi:MAG: peptide-methionine (S)-S-oxide reductase MsrA [Candidatus Marinimicrobia bacterium]|nr:peptide-methionine (S)-S-oxide reductase MsrA [Candidatus Neomarinimicrobiota bacterium]MCF7827547.1 peptide-methionine (S)-S-oxide reductase MsrA [Candidatus Neomarinimicrobiota bacterium]MCF7881591.1 peptide-methionine (S)-S-oxide reductase MsrA [Candidatus Neomarinimicrobiota bacterium]